MCFPKSRCPSRGLSFFSDTAGIARKNQLHYTGGIPNVCMPRLTFASNQEQKAYVERQLSIHYPHFRSGGSYFREFLRTHTPPDAVVMDAGCGDSGMVSELKTKCKKIIGVDVNRELL